MLLVLVVILGVLAVVQVTDAGADGPATPSIAEDPSTKSLLGNSMERTATTSHTEVLVLSQHSNVTNVSETYYKRVKYEPEQRRYLETESTRGKLASEPSAFGYASDSMGWIRRGQGDTWKEAPGLRYGARPIVRTSHLEDAQLTVLSENESSVVVEASVDSAHEFVNFAPLMLINCCENMTITFTVDRDRQLLSEVSLGRKGTSSRLDVQFSRYGNTSVSRPDDLPAVSARGLVWDLTHGPIHST